VDAGSCWSQLTVLRGDAGGLESAGRCRGPVHDGHGAAVPRVGPAVRPRLAAEQTTVDVARSAGAEVRSSALLGVCAEVAQDTVD